MNRNTLFLSILAVSAVALIVPATAMAVTDNADNLIVGAGETYTLGGVHAYNVSVSVAATGVLYVATYTGAANTGYLELHAPTITVAGTINGVGRGYRGGASAVGEGPGGGPYPGGGGAYGGNGGASGWGSPGGVAYGTTGGSDIQMGSGGGGQTGSTGGSAGGMVHLVAGETLNVTGTITVNGNQGQDVSGLADGGGGGAGGGICLASPSPTISGNLYANGGRGGNAAQSNRRGGGGGGGGRIKFFYHCSYMMTGVHAQFGGVGGICAGGNGAAGSDGTYYTESDPAPIVTSVGDIGNDQGRQVRLTWLAACGDDAAGSPQVTHYTVWRRIDDVRAAGDAQGQVRLAYPPGDWDFVTDVPARGEDEYNAIVPTLADSNSTGVHWSTFFVSGVTADPFVYYDSDPDSGYSVDNLSPAPPGGFLLARVAETNHMEWLASEEEDFDYYTLHRGASEDFVPGSSNLVATLIGTEYDDNGPILSFYKLAAVDFNGNVSLYALALPDVAGVPDDPASLSLALHVISPVGSTVTVEFSLPSDEPAALSLYDVAGRLVAHQDIRSTGAGRYTADLAGKSKLASGVYFVHLAQGGDAKEARVVVVR